MSVHELPGDEQLFTPADPAWSNDEPWPLVLVTWVDAMAQNGWVDPEKPISLPLAQTVGWLVQEDDRKLVVAGTAQSHDGETEVNQVMVIPKGMLVTIEILAPAHD